ncbi:P-loop containing nucleoside triphosphate hydrolase protein, partial [Parathielavia appendiculata]
KRLVPVDGESSSAEPSRAPVPDEPIPSVEEDGRSTTETSSVHSPTPAISVRNSEPAQGFPEHAFARPSATHDAETEDIGDRLQQLQLRSSTGPSASLAPGLLSAQAILPSAESGRREQTPRLSPGTFSAASQGSRRRRSSSMHQRRYNVRDEAPPQDRFHEPAFQQGFVEAQSLMGRLARVLGSSALHLNPDSTMKALRDKADELAKFRCPQSRIVGLVGDSGVGKSSLLNSLLDSHNLARTSNGGAACTCVVTEYYYHNRADFVIDVVWFTHEELQQQLRDLVHAYRRNHFHAQEMESEDERRDWAKRAQLAEDTFRAMFTDRFTTAVLRSDDSDDNIVEAYLNWAMDLRHIYDVYRHTVTNLEKECSSLLMRLTSDRDGAEGPGVWPYIKKIRVGLDAHILSTGLVLVDLPGLRDLNKARQNITERYIRECNEIFVVCPIGRATTDGGVQYLFWLARQARLSNVGIICTKADDIRADEAQRDWGGARATEIQRLRGSVAEAEQHLAALIERLDDLEYLEDPTVEEQLQQADLSRQRERTRHVLIENRRFELRRYLITTRNNTVATQLLAHYRDMIPGGNLHVFCASNTLYWDNRELRPPQVATTFLELSGIVTIRRYCMNLVSESQLRIATRYLRDDIPNLLSKVELWVRTGAGTADAEKKRVIREALDQFEDQLRSKFVGAASPLNQLAHELTDAFSEVVYQRRQIHQWTEGAIQAGKVWAGWPHQTYAAFCRHYGAHITKFTAIYRCWNEEAMRSMNDDLAEPWSHLKEEVQRRLEAARVFDLETLEGAVARHFEGNALGAVPETVAPLRTALQSSNRLHVRAIEDLSAKFEANLSKLRTDALSGLRTSYFGQSMESTYWSAICQSGSGSWGRKKDIINGTLRNEAHFKNLMQKLKREFEDLASRFEDDVRSAVEEHLGVTKGTLDMVRSEHVTLESERDPEFRARVAEELGHVKEGLEQVQAVCEVV